MKLAERAPFPDGHFYSPTIDVQSLAKDQLRIWPECPDIVGVDFNLERQRSFLTEVFPKYIKEFDYVETEAECKNEWQFYINNTQFSGLDARSLFVMLRHISPEHVIEIGSGFSSLLTADVSRRFMDGNMDFTCIEPYPRVFLKEGVDGISRLIEQKVESVPLDFFSKLREGDILFIDSSHVSKTGSDVNYIYLEILPRLKQGVIIHIHDIFFPHDYPKQWVLEEGRSWNEQYLLRAMLMFNPHFEVLFSSSCAATYCAQLVENIFGKLFGGGSFWMQVRG